MAAGEPFVNRSRANKDDQIFKIFKDGNDKYWICIREQTSDQPGISDYDKMVDNRSVPYRKISENRELELIPETVNPLTNPTMDILIKHGSTDLEKVRKTLEFVKELYNEIQKPRTFTEVKQGKKCKLFLNFLGLFL